MRRVGKNSVAEIYFPGCNPSFIETGEGDIMIVRNLPKRSLERKGQARAS